MNASFDNASAWWDKESVIGSLTNNSVTLLLLAPVVALVISYLVAWTLSPLRKFPGPPLACESFSYFSFFLSFSLSLTHISMYLLE